MLLEGGRVFTNPTLAPSIAAKFVSPEEVRARLLRKDGVQILTEKDIGSVLRIDTGKQEK